MKRRISSSTGRASTCLINPNGTKYWRHKYRFQGKEKNLSLGVFRPGEKDSVSLADAREALAESRKLLKSKKDPSHERKRENREKLLVAGNTFEIIAREWWAKQKGERSESHADRVLSSLKDEVFPHIGHMPVAEIEAPDVLAVVRKVESRDALDVASRVRQRTSAVFKFAVQTGRAKINPASELSGVLKTRKIQHRATVGRRELRGARW